MEKIQKKRKLRQREVQVTHAGEAEYRGEVLEGQESYVEAPTSPSSEGDAQSTMEQCSAWDSDTPSNASDSPTGATEPRLGPIKGKRTVIRQGKQVVFRDEDGSWDDEDIMVDSGNAAGTGGRGWVAGQPLCCSTKGRS